MLDVVGRLDNKLAGARPGDMVGRRPAFTWCALARCLDCLESSWSTMSRYIVELVRLSKAMQFVSSDVGRQ